MIEQLFVKFRSKCSLALPSDFGLGRWLQLIQKLDWKAFVFHRSIDAHTSFHSSPIAMSYHRHLMIDVFFSEAKQ